MNSLPSGFNTSVVLTLMKAFDCLSHCVVWICGIKAAIATLTQSTLSLPFLSQLISCHATSPETLSLR
jgi:hypothetical protein